MLTSTLYTGLGANFNDGGVTPWSSPTNIQGDTTETAATCNIGTAASPSQILRCSDFGFNLPSGAVINSVLVEVEQQAANANRHRWNNIKLLISGVEEGNNLSDTSNIPTTKGLKFFAGDWGVALTPAIINASGFGVSLKIERFGNATTTSFFRVRITIDYTVEALLISPENALTELQGQLSGVIQGSISTAVAAANTNVQAFEPAIILGGLSLVPESPQTTEVLGADPVVNISGGTEKYILRSNEGYILRSNEGDILRSNEVVVSGGLTITPAYADSYYHSLNSVVVLNSISTIPENAESYYFSSSPLVMLNSISITPALTFAEYSANNPSVNIGELIIQPEAAQANSSAVDSNIIYSSLNIIPAIAGVDSDTNNPILTMGQITLVGLAAESTSMAIDPFIPGGDILYVIPTAALSIVNSLSPATFMGSLNIQPALAFCNITSAISVTLLSSMNVSPFPSAANVSAMGNTILGSITVSPIFSRGDFNAISPFILSGSTYLDKNKIGFEMVEFIPRIKWL